MAATALIEALHSISPTTALDRIVSAADRLEEYFASKFAPAASADVTAAPETGARPADPGETTSAGLTAGEGDSVNPDGSVTGLA